MAYFEFPHTRTYDTDLGWLINAFNEISKKLDEYLENAVITFADPITWDITEQYTALTCVIDSDGTAYLSKQPVPAGVDISNTNYWLPIFNYDDNINTLRSQIAYNAQTSATTGQALTTGSLVFWNGMIYKVLVDMPAGTAFIPGTNIDPYTVDQKIDDIGADIVTIQGQITTLGDDLTLETNTRIAEDARLEGMITALKSGIFYNVKDYNILPDGSDIYDKLYDLLHDTVSATGGVVYFPAGKYTTSYTILIPPNTTFMGDGDATEIFFDETDTTLGTAMINGGSNVTIRDMKVNCNSTGQYTAVDPLPGSIGLGDIDFYSEIGKRQHLFSYAACENLKVINVSSDTFYIVQTEPAANQVKHVLYENLRCPTGMVSIMPKSANLISDVVIRGVCCDCLRLGSYYTADIDSLQVSDVDCTQIRIRLHHAQLNNIYLDNTRTAYCTTDLDTAIICYAGDAYINNVRGKTDGSQKTYFIYQPNNVSNGDLYLSNGHCEGYNTSLYYRNNKVFVSNCNLTTDPTTPYSNITPSWATGYGAIPGYAVLANPYIYNNFFIWYAVLSKGTGTSIATLANWSRIGRRITGTGQAFNNAGTKCVPVIIDIDVNGNATLTALGGVDVSDCQRLSINVLASITTT